MKEMIQNAVDAIRAVAGARPSVGLILGSGLGGLADEVDIYMGTFSKSLASLGGYMAWAVWPMCWRMRLLWNTPPFPAFPFPPRRGTRDVLCWAVWPGTASCACRGVFIFMRDIPCPTSPRPSV